MHEPLHSKTRMAVSWGQGHYVAKLLITGCTVAHTAQRCYNGDISFLSYGKMETLTPCKIETFEQIDIQFVRIDYVHERNVCSKFGKNFQPKWWNM